MVSIIATTAAGLLLVPLSLAVDVKPLTPKHEAGRCAIRGHCGKSGFFGPELPCVDNGLAEEPDDKLRKTIVELCGYEKWSTGAVCCNQEQVDALKEKLGTPNSLLASCPACKDNFYNMFCTFTCSPDQSLFINVTKAVEKNGKAQVDEIDHLISEKYGSGFYDSCKDVKFGPTNARAMDLIGGSAKNYTQMLDFLGKKQLVGSPFQMNFPTTYEEPGMGPLNMAARPCNDEDPSFRCACIDCPKLCPDLPDLPESERQEPCTVGSLRCGSVAAIVVYGTLLLSFILFAAGRVVWRRHHEERGQRRRLLQDPLAGDDEDDDDIGSPNANVASQEPVSSYQLNRWCDAAFSRLGHWTARFPGATVITSLLFVTVLALGLTRFQLETEPARLWVSPTSAAAQDKEYFDSHFGAFYRAEKVFLVNDTQPSGPGPVLSYDTLIWWMGVEKSVLSLKGPKIGATFNDVCFKPTGEACVVQSVSAYYENDPDLVTPSSWKAHLEDCAEQPVQCRPEYGQPLDPAMILSGYSDLSHVTEAVATTVTWVVNNFPEGTPEFDRAKDWETALKNRLLEVQEEAASRGLRMSFSTEMSLEEELNKNTNTDAKIIVISYLIMFLYASIALGSTTLSFRDLLRNPAVVAVQTKFGLGIGGIVIVLMSIGASVGLFSWFGLKATLIIMDVIPFIILAVGVDNIFLIVHEFERVNALHPDDDVERRVARAMGRIGPSILFSALTETISFGLGAFVGMPAVRNFAIYAAGAVLINAVLQVTLFVALLTVNQHRVEDHRADVLPFPWIRLKAARVHLNGNGSMGSRVAIEGPRESFLQKFIRRTYAPWLLHNKVRMAVVAIFGALLATGLGLLPYIELGLDQRVAIPDDSYLIPYFNDLYSYLDVGPPVYFVTRELNATQREHQREICSRFGGCQTTSLTGILEQERKRPNVSYIATPTASWIDDFFLWLVPDLDACCVENGQACFADRNPPWNSSLYGMPEGAEFVHYLQKFLKSPTDDECPLGGQAPYAHSVAVDAEHNAVSASHFRTAHTPLRSQDEFIKAHAAARRIASDISDSTGIDVFPYSVFYIFFDQYATIVSLTTTLLSSAIGIIFILSCILLGSFITASIVTLTVAMTIIDIMGAMAVMGVTLNAVSLVNLIICVGIAVEFCAHIARAFTFPSRFYMLEIRSQDPAVPRRTARARTALMNVGASVFSGITLTKVLGVSVLAFTRSKIFELYYFRVWVALVVFAASHALIFLPVVLSYIGGAEYADQEDGPDLADDLLARRNRAFVDADSDSEAEN